ncbi:MAG: MBL fold metallo-hydrolase [Deltaproteobacteria bacterium]|jgi:glyoxylase-like metal-dependent hydrolase (beta-lactamase superfamily II)|nr:MBL fold metallo-hydrolase [Deltaproteobacteria bacterium]
MKKCSSGSVTRIKRRFFLAVAAAGLLMFACTPAFVKEAAAEQSLVGKPLNMGVSSVGATSVYPLHDGDHSFPLSIFKGADEAAMLQAAGTQPIPGSFNVFLIERGKERYLVDTGIGTLFPGKTGRLLDALKEAKCPVNDVSIIFITHLHLDHIGGLVADGKPVFPGAFVYISEAEHAYWTSEAAMSKSPDNCKIVREILAVLDADLIGGKDKRLVLFKPDTALTKGSVADASGALSSRRATDVKSVDLAGHTPGHSGFLLAPKGNSGPQLLFVGDLLHGGALQLPRPDITITFDIDPDKAKAVRLDTLDRVAKKTPIAAAHLPFPGLGFAHSAGKGYELKPVVPK